MTSARHDSADVVAAMIPGEIVGPAGSVELNAGLVSVTVLVQNMGDRPIQVGSHYHFAECNAALEFDRNAAYGYRLDVPAGTGARFEPGIARTVQLVPIRGERIIAGLRGQVGGLLDEESKR